MSRAPPHSVRRGARTTEQVSGRSGSSKSKKQPTGTALKVKEEEYRRLNAELEAKTAELVKEAEHLVKGNLSILCDLETSESAPPPSDSPNRPSTTPSSESLRASHHPSPLTQPRPHTSQTHTANAHPHPSQHHTSPQAFLHSHTSNAHQKTKKTQLSQKSQRKTSTVAAPQGEIPLVEPISVDTEKTMQKVEQYLGSDRRSTGERIVGVEPGYHGDDIIPEAAEDMGPEALIRFLKAKLRVTQEELDRLCAEMGAKDKQLQSGEAKIKELVEQNSRLQRSHQSIQSQVDKHRGVAEAMKQKCSGLEAQLVALRKDVEAMKGRQKKAAGQQSALEVRLNRALEETEKYKSELASVRARSEDSSKSERQRVEQLITENKQLEKQRNELMTAFRKQMKLIDILKRQKMHIEAAKMLSFTEEEFVKALDWQSS